MKANRKKNGFLCFVHGFPNFPAPMVPRSMTNVRRRDRNHKVLRQAVRWIWRSRRAPKHRDDAMGCFIYEKSVELKKERKTHKDDGISVTLKSLLRKRQNSKQCIYEQYIPKPFVKHHISAFDYFIGLCKSLRHAIVNKLFTL
jgi:hypothetical protein